MKSSRRQWAYGRHEKPVSPWRELERRKAAFPPMPEEERAAEVIRLCREMGLDPAEIPVRLPSYAGF